MLLHLSLSLSLSLASVNPRVRELREGYCRTEITEKFKLKNPFNSIHAVALTNVGELTSGLCVMATLEGSGEVQ